MKLLKKIKKYGNAFVVNFTKEEQDLYGLVEGDTVIVSDDDMEIGKVKIGDDQLQFAEEVIQKLMKPYKPSEDDEISSQEGLK